MNWKINGLIALSLVTLGAGPCEMIQEPPPEEIDGGTCAQETCVNQLLVDVIRSDNGEFYTGVYAFVAELPDQTVLAIECYLAYLEEGLRCESGDVELMAAGIESDGSTLNLGLRAAPQTAKIKIFYNDWIIGERLLTPSYEEVTPNGPDCPPVCQSGESVMAVQSF